MAQGSAAVLRASRETDIPAITAIYADAVSNGTASFETEPPSPETMAARREGIVGAGLPYLVATREDRLLGYAYASPYRPRPAYRWTVENSVYVSAGAQGSGVGRDLLRHLIHDCERAGYRLMVAVIADHRAEASIALHRALGFRDAGLFEGIGFKHGRWLATRLMQRSLGEGTSSPPVDDRPG